MDYETYWERPPQLVAAYREAHELQREETNQKLYLQGLYNFKAFKAVIEALSYGLGGNKGQRPESYLQYPIPITEREEKLEQERNRQKTLAWVAEGQKEKEV